MWFKRRKKQAINFYAVAALAVLGIFVLVIVPSPNGQVLFTYPSKSQGQVLITTPRQYFLPPNPDKVVVIPHLNQVFIDQRVPFTAQAPLAEWHDPRQQDGCEEAAVLMAMSWVKGEGLNPSKAKQSILEMAAFEELHYQTYVDTSAQDTLARLVNDYYSHENAWLDEEVTVIKIIHELGLGRVVITPMNGRALGNPYFTRPGPERHMVLIRGFDQAAQEFITNDPGTRRGEAYRYPYEVFLKAIRDYPSGDHLPMGEEKKAMIVIAPLQ